MPKPFQYYSRKLQQL